MEDEGPKVNYIDDYSPYLLDDISHLVDGVAREECIHIYICPKCHHRAEYPIERKTY